MNASVLISACCRSNDEHQHEDAWSTRRILLQGDIRSAFIILSEDGSAARKVKDTCSRIISERLDDVVGDSYGHALSHDPCFAGRGLQASPHASNNQLNLSERKRARQESLPSAFNFEVVRAHKSSRTTFDGN
jgi:hypothetical protein